MPANQVATLSPKGLIYALPKTCFKIHVQALHTSVLPGPYAPFAEKYLGISNVALSAKNQWEIESINIFPYIEADLNTLFVVEPTPDFNLGFLRLTSEGLIIPAGSAYFFGPEQDNFQQKEPLGLKGFYDLSPTPFIAAEKTTYYSRVLKDSVFVKVPVHKTVVVEKGIEDKAREAAEFIFSLRKRRFELLSGDADFVAEGKAVEAVLNEIRRLENEYLTLFTGKQLFSHLEQWFYHTPEPQGNETSILFRFSASRGVLPPTDLSGSPVLISVSLKNSWQGTDILKSLAAEKEVPRTDLVYYRLPVPVNIKITDSQSEFLSKTMTVHQMGPLVRVPSNFIIFDNELKTP